MMLNLKTNIKMNAQENLIKNNIAICEANLMRLGERLSEATDSGNLISVRLIEAEIQRTQQNLKEELELLTELKEVKNGNW